MEGSFIIAEAGVNHNGDIDMAKQLIKEAAAAGADAVKFQTFKAESLVSDAAPKAEYQLKNTDSNESQKEMLAKLELPLDMYFELIKLCNKNHIQFMSTPFDMESLHFLVDECNLQVIKIPSGELTNAPFLLEVAKTGRKVLLSTGMSSIGEVESALEILAYGYLHKDRPLQKSDLRKAYFEAQSGGLLSNRISLLHCTTQYPASMEAVNLRCIDTMRQAFNLKVGYSDHTAGDEIALAAVARGATIIEKHFTLDKSLSGPDHKASLNPAEFKAMVKSIRNIERAMGNGLKIPQKEEVDNIVVVRKSIVASRDIKKGELFSEKNITTKRPGNGISPMQYWDILGKRSEKDYKKDDLI